MLDNTTTKQTVSAADIQVPSSIINPVPQEPQIAARPVVTPSLAESAAFFESVRALFKTLGRIDKNVKAKIFITECIDFGFDTRSRIFGAAKQMRCFQKGHVEAVLSYETGTNPRLHLCRRGEDGRYSLLE